MAAGSNDQYVYFTFAQRFHRLKPMKPFDQNEAVVAEADLNRCALPLFKDAFGKSLDFIWFQTLAPFSRNVDFRNVYS
jgi:hypothetical protein